MAQLMREAWRLSRRYRDHVRSLCDCMSFAVMRRHRIETAFAFDDDLDAVGFTYLRAGSASSR